MNPLTVLRDLTYQERYSEAFRFITINKSGRELSYNYLKQHSQNTPTTKHKPCLSFSRTSANTKGVGHWVYSWGIGYPCGDIHGNGSGNSTWYVGCGDGIYWGDGNGDGTGLRSDYSFRIGTRRRRIRRSS